MFSLIAEKPTFSILKHGTMSPCISVAKVDESHDACMPSLIATLSILDITKRPSVFRSLNSWLLGLEPRECLLGIPDPG